MMKVHEQEDYLELNESDVLDEFDKGRFIVVNKNKYNAIFNGTCIYIRNRKAFVDDIIFGQRDRLALQITYVSG